MRFSLYCIFMLSILLIVGCGSKEIKEKPEVEKAQAKVAQKAEVQKIEKKEVEMEKPIPEKIEKNDEIKPDQAEPQEDASIKWDEKEVQEEEWLNMRSLYVTQYINKPDTILYGLKNSIAKGVGFYLEKGYGVYWSPFTSKRPKDLETGFLYARQQRQEDMEESLKRLEKLGKGEHYYLMAYITCWYYCLNGQNKKAKELMEVENLSSNIEMYGIAISKEQMNLLLAKAQE